MSAGTEVLRDGGREMASAPMWVRHALTVLAMMAAITLGRLAHGAPLAADPPAPQAHAGAAR
jgi:hypothetical protein